MPSEPFPLDVRYQIGAVVLAAGESRRMGEPKMSLPWGNTTVIARVCEVLLASGVEEIWVVTGGGREQVEAALQHLPVYTVYNLEFADHNMIHSLQTAKTPWWRWETNPRSNLTPSEGLCKPFRNPAHP